MSWKDIRMVSWKNLRSEGWLFWYPHSGGIIMSKKTQYSSEYKTMLLSRFHESGMSTREFANSEGIKQTTLNYWLKKTKICYCHQLKAREQDQPDWCHFSGSGAQAGWWDQTDNQWLSCHLFKIRSSQYHRSPER